MKNLFYLFLVALIAFGCTKKETTENTGYTYTEVIPERWTKQASGTSFTLYSVYFPDANTGYAAVGG